jgi:hypothetical protein
MRTHSRWVFAAILSVAAILATYAAEPWKQFSVIDRKDADREQERILDAGRIGFSQDSIPNQSDSASARKLVAKPLKVPLPKRNDFANEEQYILSSVRIGFSKDSLPNAADSARELKFVQVTNQPVQIVSPNAWLCRNPTNPDGPHSAHWIDVYVTRAGYAVIKNGKGVYAKGTVILKQKYTDPNRKTTDLFTGMLKREKGYNSEVGDWEFFILNSTGKTVTALGRIESCNQCHAEFKDHDFVSRDYLPESGNRVEDSQQTATLRVGPR